MHVPSTAAAIARREFAGAHSTRTCHANQPCRGLDPALAFHRACRPRTPSASLAVAGMRYWPLPSLSSRKTSIAPQSLTSTGRRVRSALYPDRACPPGPRGDHSAAHRDCAPGRPRAVSSIKTSVQQGPEKAGQTRLRKTAAQHHRAPPTSEPGQPSAVTETRRASGGVSVRVSCPSLSRGGARKGQTLPQRRAHGRLGAPALHPARRAASARQACTFCVPTTRAASKLASASYTARSR